MGRWCHLAAHGALITGSIGTRDSLCPYSKQPWHVRIALEPSSLLSHMTDPALSARLAPPAEAAKFSSDGWAPSVVRALNSACPTSAAVTMNPHSIKSLYYPALIQWLIVHLFHVHSRTLRLRLANEQPLWRCESADEFSKLLCTFKGNRVVIACTDPT